MLMHIYMDTYMDIYMCMYLCILQVSPEGVVHTLAGVAGQPAHADGPGELVITNRNMCMCMYMCMHASASYK